MRAFLVVTETLIWIVKVNTLSQVSLQLSHQDWTCHLSLGWITDTVQQPFSFTQHIQLVHSRMNKVPVIKQASSGKSSSKKSSSNECEF